MDLFQKLRNMKILVIDDDEWIRSALELFFEAEGCNLLTLATAEEGMMAISEQRYDIIICDYKLPGMDGLAFFKGIQKSHPDVLKVLITAYGNENIVNEVTRTGIHDFIKKPLMTNDLEKSLARLVQQYENKYGEIIPERNK
jgi:DNA-binding NtrC family response regulator